MNLKNSLVANKIEKFIEENEVFAIIGMMMIANVILVYSFVDVYPLHTTTDELGAIVGAASLAGFDWSGVIDRSGYYGFGYYSLFAPLFKMHLSPITIYRTILIVTRVLRGSLISGIAYYIGDHYYKFSSKLELMMLSLICVFPLHPNDDANIINDVVLDIFFWLIILFLCKIIEHIEKTGKCIKWNFVYIVTAFWSSFLHTRALIILIASSLVLFGLFLYRRKISLLLSTLVIPLLGFSKVLINMYQNYIWNTSGEGLRNASVNVTMHILIKDVKTWKIWFDMVIGHISVQSLLTGGLFLLALVVVLKYLCGIIVQRQMEENIYINIVLLISVLSMGAAFSAFLVSDWFMDMYNTWDTMEKGKAYGYKSMCYVRYWNVFSMPFLFTGIYLASKREYQDCIKKSLCVWIMVVLGFVKMIVPIIQSNTSAGSFLFTYLTDRSEKVTEQFYYKSILVSMIFVVWALVIYCNKKNRRYSIFPIVLLMVIGYNWANENYNKYIMESISSMVLTSYEQKCCLEESGADIGKIYAFDDRQIDSNWYICSVLQFYFYEYTIDDEYPVDVQADDVIITYKRSEKIETDFPQLDCYELDDNEVWYTNIALIGYTPIEK